MLPAVAVAVVAGRGVAVVAAVVVVEVVGLVGRAVVTAAVVGG